MLIFQKEELKRLSPLLLFWVIYTALFFLWAKTFFYTLPFLLGLLIAIFVQPAIKFLEKKLHWSHTTATAVTVFLFLAALGALFIILGVIAVQEITAFLMQASENGFAEFSQPVSDFLNKIGGYLQKFDLTFWEQNKEMILEQLQKSMDLILGFLGMVLGFFSSLPAVITMLIVTVVSAFFIARDLEKLKAWLKALLSSTIASHMKTAAKSNGGVGQKYIFSYLFLYFITFCETHVILKILSLSYPLSTAFFTAVADVLPVLGPGFVFLPLILYQLLIGQYAKALGLLIGWGIISLIRQIMEPKLISSTVKIHPLAMLAAIYFSLAGKNLWILFYVMGLCMLYSIFRETGALPAVIKGTKEKGDAVLEK